MGGFFLHVKVHKVFNSLPVSDSKRDFLSIGLLQELVGFVCVPARHGGAVDLKDLVPKPEPCQCCGRVLLHQGNKQTLQEKSPSNNGTVVIVCVSPFLAYNISVVVS